MYGNINFCVYSRIDVRLYKYFREEFVNIARWVADCEIDPHLVEIVYALLDDDGDGHLSIKEFAPVFFQWRKSRGFQKASVQIALGELTI